MSLFGSLDVSGKCDSMICYSITNHGDRVEILSNSYISCR